MPETTFYTTFSSNHFLLSRAKNGSESGLRSAVSYRFGFNGKENDNEVKGTGNQQDYGMRIYDPRLGRFLSADPLIVQGQQYPELTPYQFASNTPIMYIDIDGLEGGRKPINNPRYGINNINRAPSYSGFIVKTKYQPYTIYNYFNLPRRYSEPSNIPGGSSVTDPIISFGKGSNRAQNVCAATSGIELTGTYQVIEKSIYTSTGGGGYIEQTSTSYELIFSLASDREAFVKATNEYYKKAEEIKKSFDKPKILLGSAEYKALSPVEKSSVDSEWAIYSQTVKMAVLIKLGPSPKQLLINFAKENSETSVEITPIETIKADDGF